MTIRDTANAPALDAAWNALARGESAALRAHLAALPDAVATSGEGQRLAARAALLDGLPEAALRHLAEAVTADPHDAAALIDLAALQRAAGETQVAARLLDAVAKLDDTYPEVPALRASLAQDAGDDAAALRHLRAACALALTRAAPGPDNDAALTGDGRDA